MSAVPSRFPSAREIDGWVASQFPSDNRQWSNNFQRYLAEIAQERRAKCKPDDGPSLEECCAAFKTFRGVPSFGSYRQSANQSKRKELAKTIAARLAEYRTLPGFPPNASVGESADRMPVPTQDTLVDTCLDPEHCQLCHSSAPRALFVCIGCGAELEHCAFRNRDCPARPVEHGVDLCSHLNAAPSLLQLRAQCDGAVMLGALSLAI